MHVLVMSDVGGAAQLRRELLADGMTAEVAIRPADAVWMASVGRYDVIALDQTGGVDVFAAHLQMRRNRITTPILIIPSSDHAADRAARISAPSTYRRRVLTAAR